MRMTAVDCLVGLRGQGLAISLELVQPSATVGASCFLSRVGSCCSCVRKREAEDQDRIEKKLDTVLGLLKKM